MKTCPCNVYPLEPHFYIEKTGVCRGLPIFLIFAPKHRLWVLVSLGEAVLTCTYNLCFGQIKKNIKNFQLKIFNVLKLKNLCLLHGQVFVIEWGVLRLSSEVF